MRAAAQVFAVVGTPSVNGEAQTLQLNKGKSKVYHVPTLKSFQYNAVWDSPVPDVMYGTVVQPLVAAMFKGKNSSIVALRTDPLSSSSYLFGGDKTNQSFVLNLAVRDAVQAVAYLNGLETKPVQLFGEGGQNLLDDTARNHMKWHLSLSGVVVTDDRVDSLLLNHQGSTQQYRPATPPKCRNTSLIDLKMQHFLPCGSRSSIDAMNVITTIRERSNRSQLSAQLHAGTSYRIYGVHLVRACSLTCSAPSSSQPCDMKGSSECMSSLYFVDAVLPLSTTDAATPRCRLPSWRLLEEWHKSPFRPCFLQNLVRGALRGGGSASVVLSVPSSLPETIPLCAVADIIAPPCHVDKHQEASSASITGLAKSSSCCAASVDANAKGPSSSTPRCRVPDTPQPAGVPPSLATAVSASSVNRSHSARPDGGPAASGTLVRTRLGATPFRHGSRSVTPTPLHHDHTRPTVDAVKQMAGSQKVAHWQAGLRDLMRRDERDRRHANLRLRIVNRVHKTAAQLVILENDLDRMKTVLEYADLNSANVQTELSSLRRADGQLELRTRSLEKSIDTAKMENGRHEDLNAQAMKQSSEQFSIPEQQISTLRKKVDTLKSTIKTSNQSNASLEGELSALSNEISEMEKRSGSLALAVSAAQYSSRSSRAQSPAISRAQSPTISSSLHQLASRNTSPCVSPTRTAVRCTSPTQHSPARTVLAGTVSPHATTPQRRVSPYKTKFTPFTRAPVVPEPNCDSYSGPGRRTVRQVLSINRGLRMRTTSPTSSPTSSPVSRPSAGRRQRDASPVGILASTVNISSPTSTRSGVLKKSRAYSPPDADLKKLATATYRSHELSGPRL